MARFGVNVDPLNPSGRPEPGLLRRLGLDWVRLVSRAEARDYASECHAAGLRVLAVVARESGGYVLPEADVLQIGNEPDQAGESSWTIGADEYVAMWRLYRDTYPTLTMIAAGLASGSVFWWRHVGPQLHGCAAVSVHPYAKTAAQARTLLRAYRAVRPDLALWATEWWRPPEQVVPFARMLAQEAEMAAWFCWSDGMVPGMGLVAADGMAHEALHRLQVV